MAWQMYRINLKLTLTYMNIPAARFKLWCISFASSIVGLEKKKIISVRQHQPFLIWHANNIPTMQLFIGISRNTQSKSYMPSLTDVSRISKIMHCGIRMNIPY